MKKTIALFLVVAAACGPAVAQYGNVKQKARDVNNRINERHNAAGEGAPPPGYAERYGIRPGTPAPQPAAPAAPAAAPPVAAPAKPSTQQQAATKLKADIAAVRTKGEVSAEDKKQFIEDLQLAVLGKSRPSHTTLTQFTDGFLPVIAAKGTTAANDAKIVQNLVVALNCAGLSGTRTKEIVGEVEGALTRSGAAAPEAGKASEKLGIIMVEIQGGASH